jgi:glutathione-specific gamma-glutamylcyclotransferase
MKSKLHPDDAWVFAYGSLMWNPGFAVEEARPALLRGYHRAFCMWSTSYRGTADSPGLVLGLDRGGACRGLAVRIGAHRKAEILEYLIARETPPGDHVYDFRPVRVRFEDGTQVTAHAFLVDRASPKYAGKLSIEQTARVVAAACGQRGTCRDYLANTVRHLDELGVADGPLHALLRQVEALCYDRDKPKREKQREARKL